MNCDLCADTYARIFDLSEYPKCAWIILITNQGGFIRYMLFSQGRFPISNKTEGDDQDDYDTISSVSHGVILTSQWILRSRSVLIVTCVTKVRFDLFDYPKCAWIITYRNTLLLISEALSVTLLFSQGRFPCNLYCGIIIECISTLNTIVMSLPSEKRIALWKSVMLHISIRHTSVSVSSS